jgi:hypothetical protein
MLLHVIESLWSHQSVPIMGRSQEHSTGSPEPFSQEPHYIHDEMIDASPGTGPNDIHDYVLEDDMSVITSTEEVFEEQDEIMDIAANSNVLIFSPIKNALQYWRHPSSYPSHDLKVSLY